MNIIVAIEIQIIAPTAPTIAGCCGDSKKSNPNGIIVTKPTAI